MSSSSWESGFQPVARPLQRTHAFLLTKRFHRERLWVLDQVTRNPQSDQVATSDNGVYPVELLELAFGILRLALRSIYKRATGHFPKRSYLKGRLAVRFRKGREQAF